MPKEEVHQPSGVILTIDPTWGCRYEEHYSWVDEKMWAWKMV